MSVCDDLTVDALVAGFDEHLRRTRGVCAGTRGNYTSHVRAFFEKVSVHGAVDPASIGVGDVVDFVGALTRRYQSGTVELATSPRSFFRFLRAQGLRTDRLEDAVPMVPHRSSSLHRHLDSALSSSLKTPALKDQIDESITRPNSKRPRHHSNSKSVVKTI